MATVVTLGAFEDMGYEVDYSMADSPCDSDHPIIDPGWQAEHCQGIDALDRQENDSLIDR